MTASRRSDHTDATRRALVDAGRYLFARRDYGDVSIEDIVTRARVTRGALDYHFDSKKDLFQTVLEVVEADLVADVEAAIAKVTDAWICWSSASTPSLTRRPNRMRCRSLRLTARQCSGGANGAGSTCA
ncbi:LOW QUALITY PROTEIN: transcriptional regulator, partial [Mycobacterium tuberculosis CPHL_A]